MDWIEVANELESHLRRGDLAYCINHVSQIIRELPDSPFNHVLTVDFTNDPLCARMAATTLLQSLE
jgi:hypothetical protein